MQPLIPQISYSNYTYTGYHDMYYYMIIVIIIIVEMRV